MIRRLVPLAEKLGVKRGTEIMDRREFILAGAAGVFSSMTRAAGDRPSPIEVDLQRDAGALPHYWESCVGSDRLAVGLREQWLRDLSTAREKCGFRSVRCHGLFDDEMGICQGVDDRGPITSFLYLDQIYDRMLEIGVKPFVELSFMPTALASSRNAIFWYRGNASPPKDMGQWAQLVEAFARHVIARYGIAEVSQWRFECWNEPNLSFWAGTQAEYFELYRQSALALKKVDSRLQVGGPATAQMMWIPAFLDYCSRQRLPVDFVSTHVYADDPQENIFGKAGLYPFEEVIPRALAQARDQIAASAYGRAPLVISEWTSQNPAFIAQTVRNCLGLADTFSYWTFNSVFEEQGPPRTFFNNAYGLIGQSGVPRPSLHAFTALHRLGARRLQSSAGPVLASKRDDGSCAILVWNLVPRKVRNSAGDPLAALQAEVQGSGGPRTVSLRLRGQSARKVQLTVIDPVAASATPAYEAMGSPQYPTREQIDRLTRSAAMPDARTVAVVDGMLDVTLPPNAVALMEIASS